MVPTPLFQRDLGEDVVAQHLAGVGQLGAAQVDLVVRHQPDELKDLLSTGDEARAQHVVHAEGLGRRGGRRSGVVQNEPVAVIGNAQAVCGLAIGGKVGADPGACTRPRAGAPSSACRARVYWAWTKSCRPGGFCRR